MNPSSLLRMRSALVFLLYDNPRVKTIHFVHGSKVADVIFTIKSIKTWALRDFLGSKEMSNFKISIDHLVIRPTKSGMNMTYFIRCPDYYQMAPQLP